MEMRLKDRVAIITGAGSGMGLASAQKFSKEGCRVVIAEINEESGCAAEKLVKEAGGEAVFVKTNIADEASVNNCVEETLRRYGKIDILYNNAAGGSGGEGVRSLWLVPREEWNNMLQINLGGYYLMLKAVIPHMIEQNYGSIINAGSANAIQAVINNDAYTAAKGGIVSLTRVLASQLGKYNIRVNCLSPGGCASPMLIGPDGEVPEASVKFFKRVPLRRIGYPEEFANVALFLASDEASYITGVVLPVDGGWNAI